MKKCPYCAEEIQDEAIKCRYCLSDLTVAPQSASESSRPAEAEPASEPARSEPAVDTSGAPADTAGSESSEVETPSVEPQPATSSTWGALQTGDTLATASQADTSTSSGTAQKYTHSGYRYVLGYGADFFGIWNRDNPSTPTERYARTDQGWRDAWSKFVQLEPNHMAVPDGGSAAAPTDPATASGGAGGMAPQIQMNPSDTGVLQYTHSGSRYLLGYGQTFFGIWDRQDPSTPVERFPRSDDGWAQAWRRYTQIENNFTEVR